MAESYRPLVEGMHDPRLRELASGLLDLVDVVVAVDGLPPTADLRLSEVPASRAESLDLLQSLHTAIHVRDLAVSIDRLPEEALVHRLRELHTSWKQISGSTDLNASGLFKRYRSETDDSHFADPTV